MFATTGQGWRTTVHGAAAPWETSFNKQTPEGVWYVAGTVKNKEVAPKILKDTVIFSFTPAWLFFLNMFLSTAVIGFTGPNS